MALSRLDFEMIERDLAVLRRLKAEIQDMKGVLMRLQHQAMLQRNSAINAGIARRAEQVRASAGQRNASGPRKHDGRELHHPGRGTGFDPNQPRVPAGHPGGGQWTQLAEGLGALPVDEVSSARTTRRGNRRESFGEPETQLVVRLAVANAKHDAALAMIRYYEGLARVTEPWNPNTSSWMRRNSFEGTVLHAEARAREVEAKLLEWRRLYPGITGNKPPIEPAMPRPGIGVSSQHPLDPEYYIKAFREIQSWPDMLNREHKGVYGGAVAAMEFDGDLVFGMNSHAPTYQGSDFAEAMTYRAILIAPYPGRMSTVLTGRRPNDALLHAESTILLRALVKTKDRTLAGRSIKVSVDMDMCPSCIKVLPYLGLELGNPRVTYVNTRTGERRTMQDGRWIAGGR